MTTARTSAMAAIVLLLASTLTVAELVGNPPMTRLRPGPEIYPLNYALSQDEQGVIYAGNADGLLSYDGARWRLIRLPNDDLARSLAFDPASGRLYVGGFGVFGYLQRGDDGQPTFVDLTPRFADRFEGRPLADIWRVQVTPAGVFFAAVKDLFFYDPKTDRTLHWFHDGRFGAGLWKDDSFWIQWRGEGIKRLIDGRFELVPGTETLTSNLYFLFERPDGRLLGMGMDGRWPLWGPGGIDEFPGAAELGPSNDYPSALAEPDGSLILGTSDGELVFADRNGRLRRRVAIGHDWVSGLHRSADGTLLASTNGAEIVALPWPPDWYLLSADQGLRGSIYAIRQYRGELYTLGSSGVFRITGDARSSTSRAVAVPWLEFEAWDLLQLGDSALLAGSYSLHRVGPDGTEPISASDLYPRSIQRSKFDEGRLWLTTEKGLALVERVGDHWNLAADFEEIDTLVLSIMEVAPDELWIGTYGEGAARVRFDGSLRQIIATDRHDEGLEYRHRNSVLLRELSLGRFAVTDAGFYRWEQGWRRDDLGSLGRSLQDGEEFDLVEAPDGNLWAYSHRRVLRRGSDGSWIDTHGQAVSPGPFITLEFTDDGPLVGALAELLHYARDEVSAPPIEAPQVRLREVRWIREHDNRHLDLAGPGKPLQTSGADLFTFRYALQDLRNPAAVRYQARLSGFERDWSEWTTVNQFTYSGLEPGEYRFEVRARDSLGNVSVAAPLRLAIRPPWHERPAARLAGLALLLVLSGLVAYGVMRLRNLQLRAHNRRLERLVRDRTRALSDANRQLKDLAERDGLTGIANRRRFDEALAAHWEHRPLSLLMLDVDHFKDFNDQRGHLAGDDLLKSIAAILDLTAGEHRGALVARYGGEEFALILPDLDREEAAAVAEEIRATIASQTGSTVSVGIASALAEDREPAQLIDRADRALYQAKSDGRNTVVSLSRAVD